MRLAFIGVLVLALASRALGATYTVDSLADSADLLPGDGLCATLAGTCTLRAAIEEANASGGGNTINFSVSGTISPATELPHMTDTGLTVTGTATCTGTTPSWDIVVDCSALTAQSCINIDADNIIVERLSITDEGSCDGVHGYAGADAATLRCLRVHSGEDNIYVEGDNWQIGGTTSADRNIIVQATHWGVRVIGSGTTIEGNYIGVDPDGVTGDGNTNDGILLDTGSSNTTIGGATSASRNIISANGDAGIAVNSGVTGTVISNNYIGVQADGVTPLCNNEPGSPQINDQGTGTTITNNVLGCQNCCAISGLEPDVTCLEGFGSQSACQTFLDDTFGPGFATATAYNGSSPCVGGLAGTCPAASATPTPNRPRYIPRCCDCSACR